MTRELAAYYLSVSMRELDELKARGELIAHGDGKRVRFKKTELDEYIRRLPERTR
jgi:excisionase family DNA binding protein